MDAKIDSKKYSGLGKLSSFSSLHCDCEQERPSDVECDAYFEGPKLHKVLFQYFKITKIFRFRTNTNKMHFD